MSILFTHVEQILIKTRDWQYTTTATLEDGRAYRIVGKTRNNEITSFEIQPTPETLSGDIIDKIYKAFWEEVDANKF